MADVIAYLRVSTQHQGRSGLGLDAQREAIAAFARENDLTVVHELVEVETGKGDDALEVRPILKEAISEGKLLGIPVVVAKLDRLSRDVHFISGLMAHKVPFIVAELGPDVDPFVLHLFAALAEKERAMISQRTKAALARAKIHGTRSGRPLGCPEGNVKSRERAMARAEGLRTVFEQVAHLGRYAAATRLNALGIATFTGAKWHPETVNRLRRRLADADQRRDPQLVTTPES